MSFKDEEKEIDAKLTKAWADHRPAILLVLAFIVLGLVMCSHAKAAAPTVTLTVSPATGTESVTPTLTWSSTGAVSCTAGGGWSGAKATSGSQTLPAVTASTAYTLTCTGAPSPGSTLLTWTAPTKNTDGSNLTDLAGFNVYRGGAKIGGGTPFRALQECAYCRLWHEPGPHMCKVKGRMVAA